MIKNNDFTPETKSEFLNLVKDKTTAFDFLVNNYNSEEPLDIDSNKIVTRLQTQFVTEDRNEESLRTKDEWDQNEFYQPNEVNVDIAQVTPGKYSSFALLKPNYNFKIDFPLDDDYATDNALFNNGTFSDSSLLVYLQLFKDKMGINISQNSVFKTTLYKHNFARKAIVKVQNVVLKMCKKPLKVTGLFAGKISLKTQYSTYQISNVEKLAKIFDAVLSVSAKNEAKAYKKQMGKKSKEIIFASQVFADILMSRVNDLQDINNNKKLERCYWLQFANTLNTFGFNAEQLKLVTEIGAKSATKVCNELGISKNKIVAKMMALGYTYNVVPANEIEAFLCAKQKDYTIFEEKDPVQDQEQAEPETVKIDTTAETVLGDNNEENDDNVSFKEEGTRVRKSTAEKVIDKSVVKYLADQSTKLAEKINQGKFKGKKLQNAIEEQRLTNLILSYYVQTVNAKPMSVKNDDTYNENEISQAKLIVKGVCFKRDELVSEVTSREKKVDQKASTFVNIVSKEKYKKTARDYFVGLVKSCINYFVNKDYKASKKSKEAEETAKLLESGARLLESAKLEADKTTNETKETTAQTTKENESKTDYVPNFVIVDNNDLGR